MSQRKEMIREGLEIDFDLLDSDLLRCYMATKIIWRDEPQPLLGWLHYPDGENWTGQDSSEAQLMSRTLDNPQEMAEGRRFLRLFHYKSYACLADLAQRKPENGEFVIRMPPLLGAIKYVCNLEEANMPPGLRDPDWEGFAAEDPGFLITWDIVDAQRFSHADAIRLTVRVMEAIGTDIPPDRGQYYEPVRVDVAEELHARAARRPRLADPFYQIIQDLSREP